MLANRLSRWLLLRLGLLLLAATITVILLASIIVDQGINFIESERVREKLERSADLFGSSTRSMLATTRDYAVWDETYDFVTKDSASYLKLNYVPGTAENLGVDWVVFVGVDGRVVHALRLRKEEYGQALDQSLVRQLESLAATFDRKSLTMSGHTLLWSGGTPVMVTYSVITDSARSKPVAGWLYFGREISPAVINAVVSKQDSGIEIRAKAPAIATHALIQKNAGHWVGWLSMEPWSAALYVNEKAAYSMQKDRMLFWAVTGVATLVLMSMVSVAVLFQKKVLRRIEKFVALANQETNYQDTNVRWPVEGNDEIDQLAGALNKMMACIGRHDEILLWLAGQDQLTELGNRKKFLERLHAVIELMRLKPGATYCLVLANINRFKEINDLLGQAAGDHVLKVVAERIYELVRGNDFAARMGGDEFAMLLSDAQLEDAYYFCTRLLENTRQGIAYEDQFLFVSASVGIVLMDPETDAHEILRRADKAMSRAKREARNTAVVFDPGVDDAIKKQDSISAELPLLGGANGDR